MTMSATSIHERLKQAQEQTHVVLTIDGRPSIEEMSATSPPETCWAGRQTADRFLDEGVWKTDGPGFERLQDWVEVHWDPDDEKQAPSGTVATVDRWGRPFETQLDAVTATRKLIAAAKLYGRERVGKCAAAFATHGTIETHLIYLLKGPPIGAAKALDDHCTLLPYGEALRKIEAESDPGDTRIVWPEPHADNVCGLECKYFERIGTREDEYQRYASPLLTAGPEPLTLLLGLVWGCGFRVFGNWHGVPAAAVAALPYRHTTVGRGTGSRLATLTIPGYGPPVRKRPLAVAELHDLVTKYWDLPEQARRRLRRAMACLRDSTERTDGEDRAIEVGIALHTLFMETDERAAHIARRAAWHYADSADERRRTEDMLARFLDRHWDIVHGRTPDEPGEDERERAAELLSGADDVLRASIKSMIAEGWPQDWDNATDRSAFRRDPPRTDSEIPSLKSDSLSWSVAELRAIDRALEAEWKPVVDEAPLPPEGAGPANVSGDLPTLASSHQDQGIPYVVIHPARLYMAHPKWPKSQTDSLDEHAEYYCTRDVERHTRLWSETATRKGLVQFEAPADAELYHPKHRDRWAQPMLSFHEKRSSVRSSSRRTADRETAAAPGSTPAADTEDGERAADEEKPAAPAPDWPQSALAGLGKEWSRLWNEFQHNVNVATNSLIYLLEAIHGKHLVERQRLIQAVDASGGTLMTLEDAVRAVGDVCFVPAYSTLRARPLLSGEPLFGRTSPGGSMERTAFNGWLYEVWNLWESRYRTQLKHEVRDLSGAIRPRQQVLGDLRHIRNNLLHNGVAKRGEAASCEILRWFAEGEKMQVRLRHVFDFLNQMGWLHEESIIFLADRGSTSRWLVDRTGEPESPPPSLISVRPLFNPEQQDPRFRYEASMVFENGVFGRTPMGPEREETEAQAKDRTRKWMTMTVSGDGNLYVPDLGTVSAAVLYRNHLKGAKQPAPGIPQPWVQFRE